MMGDMLGTSSRRFASLLGAAGLAVAGGLYLGATLTASPASGGPSAASTPLPPVSSSSSSSPASVRGVGAAPPQEAALPDTTVGIEIVVQGGASEDFRDDFTDALKELCPCFDWYFQDDQVFRDWPDDRERSELCDCVEEYDVGCNLVDELMVHDNTLRVVDTGNGNKADPSPGGDQEVDVEWNPDKQKGGENSGGDRKRPPSVGLAHELIHALHDLDEEFPRTGGGSIDKSQEEVNTTRGENQIREEQGEPSRVSYGSTNIDSTKTDDNLTTGTERFGWLEEHCSFDGELRGWTTALRSGDSAAEGAGTARSGVARAGPVSPAPRGRELP